jgi:tetratricopeptide (TPR) repeat protein
MTPADELRVVALALRAGLLDPGELARAAADWSPDGPPFLAHLSARRLLTPDQVRELAGPTPRGPVSTAADTRTPLPLAPVPATATFAPDPHATASGSPVTAVGEQTVAQDGGPPDFDPPAVGGGRYQTVRLHRTGGLGAVWLARDAVLGRDVALKTIRPDVGGSAARVARFVREARVTGRLEHPGIVPVYDLTAAADGGPAYVMRFVAGRTLAEAAEGYHAARAAGRAGRLDLVELLEAFVAVCRAVAFAHSRGVLHRDLKGSNVVLGEYGEVFVVDWGLAKEEEAAAGGAAGDTRPGSVVGTPAFLAPEAAAGSPASVATDVYGLGAVLYQLLTGGPPYDGPDAPSVLRAVGTTDPRPVRAANPSAPAALAAVCRRAMSRDPAGRYASADELATEVRRWLAGESVAAYPEPFPARAARWARRHRTAAVAAAVLLLTTAVGSATAAGLVWREQQRTAAEWRRAESHLEVARKLSLDMVGRIQVAETGLVPTRRIDQERKRTLDKSAGVMAEFAAVLPGDPGVRANLAALHRYRANMCRLLNDFAAAEESYRESVRLWAELAAAAPDDARYRDSEAMTRRDFATMLKRAGRLADAGEEFDRSARLTAELQAADPDEYAYRRTLGTLALDRGDVAYLRGWFPEAEADAKQAAALFAQLLDAPAAQQNAIDRVLLAHAVANRALALGELGRADESLREHDRVVDAVRPLIRPGASRDVRHALYRGLTERATATERVPARRDVAVKDLTEAIDGWAALNKDFPQIPLYREWGAVARRVRAGYRTGDPAVADLTASVKALEGLVGEYADVPAYRYQLGRTCAALAGAATVPAQAADWRKKAGILFRRAARLSPDDALVRRELARVDGPAGN